MMGALRACVALMQIAQKGGDGMEVLYARLIMNGQKSGGTIDRVPPVYKAKTLAALEEFELDGYGKPLY